MAAIHSEEFKRDAVLQLAGLEGRKAAFADGDDAPAFSEPDFTL